jgi:hypothetical protein
MFKNEKNIIYFLILSIITSISFRFYSSLFYPALNSDNAVTVLMIRYFHLPSDLYFWGQDRMGSLIPLLGQIPFKCFNIFALASESIVHYAILLVGFSAASTLFRSNFFKIIFAFIWFLPPIHFIDVTQFAFGIHYSLIFIVIYLFNKLDKILEIKFHVIHILIVLSLITAIWVSDLALVSVFLFVLFSLYYLHTNYISSILKRWYLFYLLSGIIIGLEFITFAKNTAVNHVRYSKIADIETVKKTIIIFFNTIKSIFLFNVDEPLTSLWAYFVVILIVFVFLRLDFSNLNKTPMKWAVFFLVEGLLLLFVIIISKWTFEANVPRRYFVCTYVSLSISILILLENLSLKRNGVTFQKLMLLFIVFIGASSSFYNLKYVWPKTLIPKSKVIEELDKLGSIGIIGEYWNSYINSINKPDKIKSTPHDSTWTVRNYSIVDSVFKQKNIYLIKDMWLNEFPDSITQFGRHLLKDGKEFKLAESYLCKYRLINN